MRHWREPLLWFVVAAVGAALLAFAYPRVFPLGPESWEVSRAEAEAIALERLEALGEPVEDAYTVIRLRVDAALERRLQLLAPDVAPADLEASLPHRLLVTWDVFVYPPGALTNEWRYRAWITPAGEVLMLLRNEPEPTGRESEGSREEGAIDEPLALERAWKFLAKQGFDVERLDPEPHDVDRQEEESRVTLTVEYRERAQIFDGDLAYGLGVRFEGDELAGFQAWYDDPRAEDFQPIFRQTQLASMSRGALIYLLLPFVVVSFLKRYHDGQLGVRRAVQFFLLVLSAGAIYLVMVSGAMSTGTNFGLATRVQTTWIVGLSTLVFYLSALAVLTATSWATGESLCRDERSAKLAAIDAFFRLRWANATLALSSLRGFAAGLFAAALVLALSLPLQRFGVWVSLNTIYENGISSALPALGVVAGILGFGLPLYLFGAFFVPSWACSRFGPKAGLLPSLVLAVFLIPSTLIVLPLPWGIVPWFFGAAMLVLLFRFGDLFSALLAGVTTAATLAALPLLGAADPWLQANGWAIFAVLASPLAVSLRHLGTDNEFTYSYDDIPPHVRRIAERERQRVELETARNIQSSILPELPPSLNGIEVAHTYLPATEVGGDFYDVLALEDGRLALAVGDVAGHGVSSGLVMSMAKSALAVQVTFNPAVEAVFKTLNRMVYQSARQRLLATLCYAILDPARREFLYASAGHLYPYRVTADGRVEALESTAYPLGVRSELQVRSRLSILDPGDVIFLYSDGLVEARPEKSDELYGFDRLEESLRRHAGKSPEALRDGVLADVENFTDRSQREDDLTLLVLRLPAA